MKVNIRQILPGDNETLAHIIRNCFIEMNAPTAGTVFEDPTTDDLHSFFQAKSSVLWVAEVDDKVAGCCGIFPTEGLPEGTGELVKFYLASRARGKGIGKMLLDKTFESARELGYKKIYLESLPEFTNALNLYIQNGFLPLSKALGESSHPGCNVWMIKDLGSL